MNIGIAGPIEVYSLKEYLPEATDEELKLGLGGTAVNQIIEGLLKAGHKVTVFTLDPKIDSTYILEGNNLKVIFGHFRLSAYSKMFDFCRKEYLQIKKMINDEKGSLDLVNAHWSYEYAIGTILAGVPHIITFRDDSPTILKLYKHPYRLTRLLMDFWIRRNARAFSFNSTYLKSKIGLNGVVIPNPIGGSEIKQKRSFPGIKSKWDIFFAANGWSHSKNPDSAIEAFGILRKKNKNVHLHLFGKGYEECGESYQIAKSKYCLDGISFRGFIKHQRLLDMMDEFDIHLHTSREESFGNTLIEAMAKGIPVIGGKDSGAVPWVLDNGKAGILVDINEPEEIAQSLEKLISGKELYETLSQRSIENVSTRFALDAVTDRYVNEYQKQIECQA